MRAVVEESIRQGVRVLTLFAFSSENWRRPADEVGALMGLFVEVLSRELENLQRQRVRVRVIGSEDGMPERTMKAFRDTEAATADNDVLTLVVALNYGGRQEIATAMRRIAAEVADGDLVPGDIDDATISSHLYTHDIPDPDLVIRTSGELRVSNFLLWQIAYSELWVTAVLWPEFRRGDLLRAIVDYQRRSRRFGGRP